MTEPVLRNIDKGLCTIAPNRPDKLNALSEMFSVLAARLAATGK